jgi:hypothetical protein
MRTTKITISGESRLPFSLRMARSLCLLPDGTLHLRWLLIVGLDRGIGNSFSARNDEFSAPVGSVQQDEMIDRFAADLGAHLPAAVQALVDALPDPN